jgi:hypothetical protein
MTAAWWVRPWVSTPPMTTRVRFLVRLGILMSPSARGTSQDRHAPPGRADTPVTRLGRTSSYQVIPARMVRGAVQGQVTAGRTIPMIRGPTHLRWGFSGPTWASSCQLGGRHAPGGRSDAPARRQQDPQQAQAAVLVPSHGGVREFVRTESCAGPSRVLCSLRRPAICVGQDLDGTCSGLRRWPNRLCPGGPGQRLV